MFLTFHSNLPSNHTLLHGHIPFLHLKGPQRQYQAPTYWHPIHHASHPCQPHHVKVPPAIHPHVWPFNWVLGVKGGMDFVIESMQLAINKYIQLSQSKVLTPLQAHILQSHPTSLGISLTPSQPPPIFQINSHGTHHRPLPSGSSSTLSYICLYPRHLTTFSPRP